jgi:hypothetical protein
MAYGFQNTCDTDEFFYLDNVPGYVSVNEFYYIVTQEGDIFCGKYVNIPAVDYQIQTYNLVGMTAQTSAPLCNNINPCPDVFIPTTQNFSTTQVNKCACLTEYPLGVDCVVPNVTPQNPNVTVNLKITGGTAPYSIYSANTETLITNVAINGGTSNIPVSRPSGTYCFDIYDFYQTKISHCCTVNTASTILTATYSKTNTNQCYNSGSVAVTINEGTPPYTVYRNNQSQGQTTNFAGLGVGANTFYVTDSSTPMQQTPISNQNITVTPIIYPNNICMTITICGQQFNLTFNRSTTTLCPPSYSCTNQLDIGAVNNIIITGNTNTLEWGSNEVTINPSQISLPSNCNLPTNTLRFIKAQNNPQPAGSYDIEGAFAAGNSNVVNGICQNPPTFTTSVQNTCAGSSAGVITVIPQGGTPPYTVSFNNIEYPNQTIFNNLAAGQYTISVSDSLNLESSSSIVNVTTSSSIPYTQITQCQTIEGDIFPNNGAGFVYLRMNITFNNIPQGNTITIGGIDGSIFIRRIGKFLIGAQGVSYTFQDIRIYKNNNPVVLDTIVTNDLSQGNFGVNSPVSPPICTSNFYMSNKTDQINNTNINDITVVNGDSLMIELRAYISIELPTGIMPPSCYNSLRIQASLNLINITDDIPSDVCYNNTVSNYTFIPGVEIRRYYGSDQLEYVPAASPGVITCPQA